MEKPTVQLQQRPHPTLAGRDAKPASPTRPLLHHVQLKTTRLDEMIAWYRLAVGLEIAHKGSRAAWLTNDDANHRIAFVSSPALRDDPDKESHAGMHHTAWEYGTVDELLETYERLREHGFLPHRTVNHGPILSFYYADPDGNSVELQVDNYGDWEISAEFFESPEFARDPFGPGVDPEQLKEARHGGASRDELHRRGYAGEFPNARLNDRRMSL